MASVIEIKDLTKTYGSKVAVDRLNLTVEAGEIFGFLGPNGAGKTTTLLMLLGLTQPTGGSASVLGHDPYKDPLQVKRQVGYLPENVGFYTDLTATENLSYVARLNNINPNQIDEKVAEALKAVGLAGQIGKLVGAFSRGMRQRLGIAELLIKEPKLVFLDEPTLGLDPDGINRMLDLIVGLSKERGIAVMLSSHLLHQVQRICHRVGIMMQGKLIAKHSMSELKESGDSLEEMYMRYFTEA